MENVRKLETVVASWYKNMPHLPARGQKWLAENAWWLVLIWVILAAFGVVSLLLGTFVLGAIFAGFGPAGAAAGGLAFILVTITLLFAIAAIVLGAMAISPLKMLQKKGWTLLFLIILINVVADVLSFVFNLNLFGLIWNLLIVGVAAYFLFEIRGHFDGTTAGRKKVTAKQAKA